MIESTLQFLYTYIVMEIVGIASKAAMAIDDFRMNYTPDDAVN